MQRALTARNLYQGGIDGIWGPKTESALRNFQTQSGLEATGELNEPTARALGIDQTHGDIQKVSGIDRKAASRDVQAGADGASANVRLDSLSESQAREMQQRLQLLGYYRGSIDGRVGDGTRAALARYFQKQAELARQGVISNSEISLFGTDVSDVQTAN
jgi:peptidoglycan hydrolase-like protein with peptidoglycan-binding domain